MSKLSLIPKPQEDIQNLLGIDENGVEWRNVVGYEGLYIVSSDGRVKNTDGRLLKGSLDGHGYRHIVLSKIVDGVTQRRFMTLSRMIAIAFLPNPDNKPDVDHINGDHTDDRLENLRWATHKENVHNENTFPKLLAHINRINKDPVMRAKALATKATPEFKAKLAQLPDAKRRPVRCIETGESFDTVTHAAEAFGCAPSTVTQSCKRTKAGNKRMPVQHKKSVYHFEYIIGD